MSLLAKTLKKPGKGVLLLFVLARALTVKSVMPSGITSGPVMVDESP